MCQALEFCFTIIKQKMAVFWKQYTPHHSRPVKFPNDYSINTGMTEGLFIVFNWGIIM